jgi:hypothetical protein
MDASTDDLARQVAEAREAVQRTVEILLARLRGASRPEELQPRAGGVETDRGGPAGRVDT